jgi:rubrerythrin
MDKENDRLTDGLRTAIQMEADGHNFYNMAASSTRDEKGRQTFEMLAKEELSHMRFLSSQLKSVSLKGSIDENVHLDQHTDLSTSESIFSDDFLKNAKEAHIEMSALSIGIRLELASIEFYENHAQDEIDKFVKSFYKELADWETVHYHALLAQRDMLLRDYWAAGQFAPF